jgi:hypothetical protein
MMNAKSARMAMELARRPKTHFDKILETTKKAIKCAANNGCGFVVVETGGLEYCERKQLNTILTELGYRFKWHNTGDYDDEKIRIMWEEL